MRFRPPTSRAALCSRSATRSARAGTASSAAAVGVGARRSDTKSISVVSVSWPTAEISGMRQAAAARMTISSLNAIRSSRLPPPRATISTSGRGTGPPADRASKPAMAAAMRSAAPSPCTGTGQSSSVRGKRRAIVVRISWITAPRSLLTTPITAATRAAALAAGVEQALGGEADAQHLDARQQGAGAGVFHPLDDELVGRALAIGGNAAGGDDFDAVLRHHAEARHGGLPHHAGELGALVFQARNRCGRKGSASVR